MPVSPLRRTAAAAMAAVGAVTLALTGCSDTSSTTTSGFPHVTAATSSSDDSGGTTDQGYDSWATTVSGICTDKLADYNATDHSGAGELEEIPSDAGFSPVPSDSRAQAFDTAITALSTVAHQYGDVNTNAIAGAEAQQAVAGALTDVETAAEAIGATACAELARRGVYR